MRMVKIIADSTCDLSVEILRKYDITLVPLYVDFGDGSQKDGVDLLPEQLFKSVKEKGIIPKTAAPSPYDFISCFKEFIDLGQDIIVFTLSAKMSSTYQNACLAASEFPDGRIHVIDSQNITTGIGSLVMIAGDMAIQGKNANEIAYTIKPLVSRVRMSFVIDTLEYLYKGGRCNVIQNLVSTMLKIRPIIAVEDGSMLVADKIRGDKRRALDKMIDNIVKNSANIDYNRIFIVNSCGSDEEASYVEAHFKELLPGFELIMTKAGCVISSHCGEKTLGLSYIVRDTNI